MPEENMTELDRNDNSDQKLNSSEILRGRIILSRRIMSTADNCDQELDSNSDDGRTSSPENGETPIGVFEDSNTHEESEITASLRAMRLGSDTSADSVESNFSGIACREAPTRSSSENADTSSSDEESDSEFDWTEEGRRIRRENLRNIFSEKDRNANFTTGNKDLKNDTSRNNNGADTKSLPADNTTTSTGNKKSDVTSENDSDDEDGENLRTRGRCVKQHSHGGKPYETTTKASRGSPRNADAIGARTPEYTYPGDLTAENIYPDNLTPETFYAEELSPFQAPNQDEYRTANKSPNDLAVDSFFGNPNDPLHLELLSFIGDNQDIIQQPDYAIPPSPTTFTYDSASQSPEPTQTVPISDLDPSSNLQPIIQIDGFPMDPFEMDHPWTTIVVRQPLSSDSSGPLSHSNEPSPRPYDYGINDSQNITTGLGELWMNNGSQLDSNTPEEQNTPRTTEFQRDATGTQSYPMTFGNKVNRTSVYPTPFPECMVDLPQVQVNLTSSQSNIQIASGAHMEIQGQYSPSQVTYTNMFPLETTAPTLVQNGTHPETPSTTQFYPQTTKLQNPVTPPITSSDNNSFGVVTVNPSNGGGQHINTFKNNNVQAQCSEALNHNLGQTRVSPSHTSRQTKLAPKVAPPQDASPFLTPKSVEEFHRRSSSSKKNSRRIAPWKLLSLPPVPAVERLKLKVSEEEIQKAMIKLYGYSSEDIAAQDDVGNTHLLIIVSNPNILSSHLAYIGPLLSKMETIPQSLTLTNEDEHDALYLAAVNCPEFDFVTGVLAAAILKSQGAGSDVWKRTYNRSKKDTLIHVLAAKGDKHATILQELFAIQESSGCTLFDLSAKNIEGKTPLHVAVEAHNPMGTGICSVNMVRWLIKYGASPIITEDRNGNTALHTAISSTCCLGIVQALLSTTEGHRATNIVNYSGNTPVHLAAAVLSTVQNKTQEEVCYQLIAAGGLTNVRNRQNQTPLGLVAQHRREAIEGIFHRKSRTMIS